jgi:DNA-binding PadR family transcriptional regulator
MASSDRSTTKPLTGTFFYVLLALADQDRYGLDIVEEVSRRTAGEIRLGPGTLYNAVKKMLDAGLIKETNLAGPDDDPRRRYYGITARGEQTLQAEAARLERLVSAARAKDVLPAKRAP